MKGSFILYDYDSMEALEIGLDSGYLSRVTGIPYKVMDDLTYGRRDYYAMEGRKIGLINLDDPEYEEIRIIKKQNEK